MDGAEQIFNQHLAADAQEPVNVDAGSAIKVLILLCFDLRDFYMQTRKKVFFFMTINFSLKCLLYSTQLILILVQEPGKRPARRLKKLRQQPTEPGIIYI